MDSCSSIAIIPIKRTGKHAANTPCIFEMEINEIIGIESPQIVILTTIHLKDESEPTQIPLTLIHPSHKVIQVVKHTII